ncbi:MAG: GAF domain-containing protein, partial [Deltaproteobacteria bacterium]|nr:GAF domain-containing protein [Deltaproteobacteria bacterium]
VTDDPRIQYPEEAKIEGISSILSVPITLHDRVIGALRVYSSEPWEFTLDDVNFVHAVAQIVGMSIDLCRLNKGYKTSIEILKTMRDPELLKTK